MAKKRGSGLAILALLVGIVAIGIGGYNFYVQTTQTVEEPTQTVEEIGNTWYKSEPDYFRCSIANTYKTFSDLTVQFNISSGESAYFSYNGWIFMRLNSPTQGLIYLRVYFSLDGQRLESPHIRAQDYYDGSTYIHLPASLQHFNSSLSPGVHNITIVLYGNFEFNGVRESTLFVQTYSS